MGTIMSCATLSCKVIECDHCRAGPLVLSEVFFAALAGVAALKTERGSGIASSRAIHARSSICFYFTARGAVPQDRGRLPRRPLFLKVLAEPARTIASAETFNELCACRL